MYRHYDGKEALLRQVCAEGFRIFSSYLLQALVGPTPRERMVLCSRQYLRFALEHPSYYRVIFMGGAEDFALASIIGQRLTGQMQGEFVVFLIGMRVNRWWKIHKWLRVALAMPRMLRELAAHPELGFLGAEQWSGRTTMMVSYWRSMDDLMAYAKSRNHEHLPAWKAFNKLVGTNGDVGIWHETYRVGPGDYENVYVNMMPLGMGRVGQLVAAHGPRETAAGRLAPATT